MEARDGFRFPPLRFFLSGGNRKKQRINTPVPTLDRIFIFEKIKRKKQKGKEVVVGERGEVTLAQVASHSRL